MARKAVLLLAAACVSAQFSFPTVGTLNFPPNGYQHDPLDMQVVGNIAYTGSHQHGLVVVDITSPFTPLFRSETLPPAGVTGGYRSVAAVAHNQVLLGSAGPVYVYDATNPVAPVLLTQFGVGCYGLDTNGAWAGCARLNGGFWLYRVDGSSSTTPAQYAPTAAVGLPGSPRGVDVILSGTTAYVTGVIGSVGKLYVLDISTPWSPNPTNPIPILSTTTTNGEASKMKLVGNLLYVACAAALEIYDVTNGAAPLLVGSIAPNAQIYPEFYAVDVVGDLAYVTNGDLQVYNVANPAAPVWVMEVLVVPPPPPILFNSVRARSVAVVNGYCHVTFTGGNPDAGMRIIDTTVATPSPPITPSPPVTPTPPVVPVSAPLAPQDRTPFGTPPTPAPTPVPAPAPTSSVAISVRGP